MFQSLLPLAVGELCEVADSLITPVRLGVARPTAPFPLVSANMDAIQGSEELFTADPPPLRPLSTEGECRMIVRNFRRWQRVLGHLLICSLAPLNRSLAPHCLLCSRAPLRSLAPSLPHSLPTS